MSSDLTLRAAATPADLVRLRAFVGARGAVAARALERHLGRPRYHPALTRLAERAGALAGYALLRHQRLRLGTATIETGAIEQFAQPADAASFIPLLGDCLGTLLENGLPLAMLRGDAADYRPFGFAPCCLRAETWLAVAGAATDDTLRPTTGDDLEDLAALYAACYRDIPLAEERAAPDWRDWQHAGPPALALEDRRGRLVAYAFTPAGWPAQGPGRAVGDHVAIAEAAAADAGAARALITALQTHAGAAGLRRICLTLPPSHPVAQAALHQGGETRISAPLDETTATTCAGVVDLPGLLEALVPEFERRLAHSRYAGWSGNVRVEIETERIVLALTGGRAEIIDGSRPADVRLRRVALPGLAQLCLGYRAAADLRATGGLDCDDSALGLIDVLFPVVMPFGD